MHFSSLLGDDNKDTRAHVADEIDETRNDALFGHCLSMASLPTSSSVAKSLSSSGSGTVHSRLTVSNSNSLSRLRGQARTIPEADEYAEMAAPKTPLTVTLRANGQMALSPTGPSLLPALPLYYSPRVSATRQLSFLHLLVVLYCLVSVFVFTIRAVPPRLLRYLAHDGGDLTPML